MTVTAADLSQHAADARLARAADDKQQAGAIADCAAQAAAAIKLGNEATALRTAWVASRTAKDLAAQTRPGDEVAADTAARQTAGWVAQAAKARAAESAVAAHRASSSVAAAAEEVVEAANTMALAARLGAYSQESAIGGIAFNLAAEIAKNAADAPPPPA